MIIFDRTKLNVTNKLKVSFETIAMGNTTLNYNL